MSDVPGDGGRAPAATAALKASIVVPTHERPAMLARTLAALERQTVRSEEFEVIVVDDGSAEAARREARALRPALSHYRWVEKPQGGLASARNRGAAEARGETLLFLDDDVVPAPNLIEQHLRSHAGSAGDRVVVGALPYPEGLGLDAFLWYLERSGHYDLYRNPRKYPGGIPPMPPLNGNSSVGRARFHAVGGYDESFRRYGSEDLDLGYRLARSGARFVYNPDAVGYHHHVKDFERFCHDMETAGESLIDLYRRYPEIKAPKKIDVVTDPIRTLPWRKRAAKAVLAVTLACPWLLAAPRWVIRRSGGRFVLRAALFPLYRWVAHYHYAVGMRRGLAQR